MRILSGMIKKYYNLYLRWINYLHIFVILWGNVDTFILYAIDIDKPIKYFFSIHFIQGTIIILLLLICFIKKTKFVCILISIERSFFYFITFAIPYPFNPFGLIFAEGEFFIDVYSRVISCIYDNILIEELINFIESLRKNLSIMLISVVFIINYVMFYFLIRGELKYLAGLLNFNNNSNSCLNHDIKGDS